MRLRTIAEDNAILILDAQHALLASTSTASITVWRETSADDWRPLDHLWLGPVSLSEMALDQLRTQAVDFMAHVQREIKGGV